MDFSGPRRDNKIPTLNGTENWMEFINEFLDYYEKFPEIRGMIKRNKKPNWSERLRLPTTSFVTMDVAEPSGATTRSKAAKEKSEEEGKAREFSELERMRLKSAFSLTLRIL